MDTNQFTFLIYREAEGNFTPFKSYDARVATFKYQLAFYSKKHYNCFKSYDVYVASMR